MVPRLLDGLSKEGSLMANQNKPSQGQGDRDADRKDRENVGGGQQGQGSKSGERGGTVGQEKEGGSRRPGGSNR
jgi:hypothetical protein